jgi:PAS domain S-box-containing protein
VLVAACLVPAFLMVFALVFHDYQRQRELLASGTVGTARALANNLDRQLTGIQTSVAALATSPLLQEPDEQGLSRFHAQAQQALAIGDVMNIVLLRPDGQQALNTLQPYGSALPVSAAQALFSRHAQSNKPVISGLVTGATRGKPIVVVAVPVMRGDAVAYSLLAIVSPERLRGILLEQRLPDGWIAAIVDSRGAIVARTLDHEKFVGVPVRPALLARMKEVQEDSVESTTVEGIPVVSSFSRSNVSGWSIVIGVPRSSLEGDLRRSMAWLVFGAALLAAATVALALRLGGSIARTIHDLGDVVGAMGRREKVRMPRLSFSEAEVLAHAFVHSMLLVQDAEATEQEHEARLRAILESAMDAIIVIDDSQRVVLFNSAACGLFGYAAEEVIGGPVDRLIPAKFRDRHGALVRAFGEGHSQPRKMGIGRKIVGVRFDGTEFPIDASISAVSEGGQRFYTVILRDMTHAIEAQEALARSNLDLQQFAFVASHDLRSPLRSVKGFLGLLAERFGAGLPPQAHELIRRAGAALDQLDELTQDLLTYARLGDRSKPLAMVDCNVVVRESLTLLDAPIRESSATIEAGPLPTLRADRVQLVQLFQNLLSNAIKYRRRDAAPVIGIRAQRGEGEWVFSVQDNGIGIDERHLQRIFEIFKRLHTAHEYPGNGIGLAVCQRIVERHGGRIWVDSEPGRGSTFHFSIADMKEGA